MVYLMGNSVGVTQFSNQLTSITKQLRVQHQTDVMLCVVLFVRLSPGQRKYAILFEHLFF